MKYLSNSYAVCKIKDICNFLSNVQIKSDYNVHCGIYRDKYCQTPSATHASSGTFKFGVIKGIAYLAVLAIMISVLRSLMRCIRD